MRYYEIYLPGKDEPHICSNARALRNLPDGTRVYATVTDRDGSLIDQASYPVKNGRVIFPENKRTAKIVN